MKRFIVALVAMFTAANASSAIISNNILVNNTNTVSAFSLSESFTNFYGRSEVVVNSSNTGFERTNTAVFLLAEYLGEYALIATFGAFEVDGDFDGASFSMFLNEQGTGNFVLLDDPTEQTTVTGSTTKIDFTYFANRNDGFIYSLGDGLDVDLSIDFANLTGLDSFVFLNSDSPEIALGTSFSLSNSLTLVSAPAPNVVALILGVILVMGFRKKNFKNL